MLQQPLLRELLAMDICIFAAQSSLVNASSHLHLHRTLSATVGINGA
jgi:hypothetical protein